MSPAIRRLAALRRPLGGGATRKVGVAARPASFSLLAYLFAAGMRTIFPAT
jgi:hypothetical protein